jgi:hypothetical protein
MKKVVVDMAVAAWTKALDKGPACALFTLLLVVILGSGGYVYASRVYATTESVEKLSVKIDHGFESLGARMDLSDADNLVRDLQAQRRAKEREIDDLEMVIAEMDNPNSDSASVLRNRVFAARQDLAEIDGKLTSATRERDEAARKYQDSE